MSIFFTPMTQMLAMNEGAGGLFDFNATLPLMAIQFILLTVVLTFLFYQPVSDVIEKRETYINGNLTQASEKLILADALYRQYETQLKIARINAQSVVTASEKEAKALVASEINQARKDAANLIAQTNNEMETEKSLALEKLGMQVDELAELIQEKVIERVLPRFSKL